jgi:chaperonin GroES
MKLIPLNDKVLILPAVAESKSPGGIIIPGTAEGKPTRGVVVALGPKANGGPEFAAILKVDAEVMFPQHSGVEVDIDGVKHRHLPAEELLGIITA